MSDRADRLHVVAHFPGRLRVRAATFRVLPEVATEVVRALEEEAGVSSATASPVTGSLLILYDPHETQLLRLIRTVLRVSGLVGVEVDDQGLAAELGPGAEIRRFFGDADAGVRRATDGRLDLRAGVPGGLALLSLGTVLAGRFRFPEWYDFLFWSFTAFTALNPSNDGATPPPPAGPRGRVVPIDARRGSSTEPHGS